MESRYVLTLSDETGQESEKNSNFSSKAMTFKSSAIFIASYSALKSGFNFVKSNYGNMTGDNIAQQKINSASDIIGTLGSVAVAFSAGPVAGAVAIGAVAVNTTLKAAQRQIEVNNRNAQISVYKSRIGRVISEGGR